MLVLLNAIDSPAQIYQPLHNFAATSRDGFSPLTDLVLVSNTLYGTTASGGTNGNGTIFKINTDGTGYGILRSLTNSPSPEAVAATARRASGRARLTRTNVMPASLRER